MGRNKSAMWMTRIEQEDGPAFVFLLSKPKKLTLRQRLQKKIYSAKKNCIEMHIGAVNHSIVEVCEYIQKRYGFTEAEKDTLLYQQEYTQTRAGLMAKYAPELLGKYVKQPELTGHSEEELRTYLGEMEDMQKAVQTIPAETFDIKLHIFIRGDARDANTVMHITVEENYGLISGGASGSKRLIRKFHKMYRDIYKYYGVTEDDIRNKSERYNDLIRTLAM